MNTNADIDMNNRTIVQYVTLTSLLCFAKGAIMTIYVPFLLSSGLNLLEVSLLNMFFFSTLFICEIPTGAFADIYGRKASFVLSCFLISMGAFMYSVSRSFWGFASSEVVEATGTAFASGAFKAWLVDKLQHHGYTKSLLKALSKTQIFNIVATVLATIVGSFISNFNIRLPFVWLGVFSFITGVIAFFWLKEEYFVRKNVSLKLGLLAMKDTTTQSIEFGIKNKVVRFLLVIGLIQVFAIQAPNMQWTPYFLEYLKDKSLLGYLGAVVMIGMAIGSLIANKFLSLVKDERKALTICQLLAGAGLVATTMLPLPLGMVVFILHEIPRGMFFPLKDKFLQDNIPSHARATISSFESISPHLGGIFGLLVSGYVASRFGIPAAWIMSGSFMFILTLIVSKGASSHDDKMTTEQKSVAPEMDIAT